MRQNVFAYFTGIFFILVADIPAVRAGELCDSDLKPVSQPAIRYQLRSKDRCEGFYTDYPVSRIPRYLQLVGLLRGQLKPTGAISISAPGIGRAVRVRAAPLPEKTYYRLDGSLPPGGVLRWPLDVLRRGGLKAAEVRLYGYLADKPKIFVPLRAGKGDTELTMTLRASEDLVKLLWQYAPLRGGNCGAMDNNWQTIEPSGGFESGTAIEIKLPAVNGKGLCVEAAGLPSAGNDWLQPPPWRIRTGSE
ncbi:MAG: hypothetical protein GY862_28500 [Gammaproteobacteria bacterium]|nr:hypothetical protein [Gammaproteobacteria bacterium]